MAEAFAKTYGKGKVDAYSAGSKPSGVVNSNAIEVLKQKGIDITGAESKGFEQLREINFDYVITMGCGDVCPFIPAKKNIDWQITDPKGKDMGFFSKTRDEIEKKVKDFITSL
jgi:protein-tyrosine-phosphatase